MINASLAQSFRDMDLPLRIEFKEMGSLLKSSSAQALYMTASLLVLFKIENQQASEMRIFRWDYCRLNRLHLVTELPNIIINIKAKRRTNSMLGPRCRSAAALRL